MTSIPNPPLNTPQNRKDTGKMDGIWSSWFTRITAFINNLTKDFAPSSATFITQIPSSGLSNEQPLSVLNTGYAKVTNGTGVITTTATVPTSDLSGTVTNSQLAGGITASNLIQTDLSIATSQLTGTGAAGVLNLSGINTGDQTNISGNAVTATLASTVTTNANLTGDVTSVGNAATVIKLNGTTLSGLATGILKNTTGTGVPSIAAVGDFPTLNQNTSGSAASLSVTLAVASGGTGVTKIPNVSAYQNAATTLATAVFTKILFQVIGWDNGSYFASSRYTPLIAGTYLVNAGYYLSSTVTATQYQIALFKNGVDIGNHSVDTTTGTGIINQSLSRYVQINGTTDYLEIYGYNGSGITTKTTTGDIDTYFQACWVGP